MATIYYTAASLDGYLADAQHSLDWLMQFPEDDSASDIADFIGRVGALCMGSHTYEWMWRHHIGPDAPHPMAWPYVQPTWVFSSRTLPVVPDAPLTFVRGDVRPVFEDMRAAAGSRDLWIVGGGELAGQFYDAGLLDEIIVTVAPVTLGSGMPLLPRRVVTPPLVLKAVRRMGTAFARLHYMIPRP